MWITPKKNTRKERSQRSWIFSRCNPSGHGAHLRTQECILVQIQVIEYSNNFTLETYEGRTRSPCRFRSNRNCSETLPQVEEGLLRRRSKAISPTSALGYRDRPGQRCPKSIGLQDIPINSRRTGKTRRLHSRKPGERIYPTLALPILVTLFLRWEKGWEVPTSGRLQEAKLIHGARLIPPPPYPRVSGYISKNTGYCQAFYWCTAGKQCKLHKFTSQI